ncbi:hypothetical protein HG537_0C05760 [Torulaspora globosa]|uniref:Protein HID1 n=1 Tax=Torulaspora globosa TaxID=48254 RepID=A0A7H9HT97_9SACH|nr:hypothetical protein HG537_0C05760 [Torulaspora sp. CBS 2947]
MGNTDSRLGALYRDHVFKLAGAGANAGNTSDAIPLFCSDVDEMKLVGAYLNREPGQQVVDNMFEQFYVDFISAGNGLTMELVNSNVSPRELQYIVRANPGNFANLLRFVSLKIVFIANGGRESLGTEELEAQLVQLLVCVRILTKIMPWYFAVEGNKKGKRSVDMFWTRDGDEIFGIPLAQETDLPPLGLVLIRSLVRLLFIEGFTITVRNSPGSLTHFLWENGISTQDFTYHNQSPRIDSNRLEIMNALLSLCSSDLYKPNDFISENHHTINKFLFCLTALIPEYDLICFIASLINLICRFCSNHEDETKVPYQELGYKQNHQQHLPHLRASLVLSSLQILNLMSFNNWNRSETFEFTLNLKLQSSNDVQNPLPNICLSYLSTFNREFDLKLILTSFAKTFKLPIELAIEQESNPLSFLSKRPPSSSLINSNYNNNNDSAKPNNNSNTDVNNEANDNMGLPLVSPLLLQWLVFFTKLIQTNKFFENYVADKFACKIIVFSVYYISFYRDNPEVSPALIPLCSNLALLLSSRKLVLAKMLDKLTPNYYTNKIPNFFKLSNGNINNITYRDFTLIHLCHLAIGDVRDNNQLRPWLFELIYNLLPIPSNLKDEDLIQLSFKRQSKALRYGGLSYNASMVLLQLISKMSNKKYLSTFATNGRSTRSFITSPGFKLDLLALLLRAIVIYIVVYYNEALNLIFIICRHQRVFSQLREAIDTISKALQGNGIIEGVGKVQLQDYLEYTLNPRLLQDDLVSDNRDTSNNSSSEEFNSQNITFRKNLQDQSGANEFENNESNDETDDEDPTKRMKKDQDLDQEALNLTKVQSAAKNTEIYEQADIADYCALSNKTLFKALRPRWPVGLTAKAKAKSSATNALSNTWIGAESLQTMNKIIRIILRNYPEIATITTSDYYRVIDDISIFKDKFENAIQKSLPVVIREMNEAKPMRIDLTEENLVYQQWIYDIIWSDIFNTHSAPYSISQANVISVGANGYNIVKESAIEPISPTMPKLERWNSNGSALSRTNSNNSSLLSYFSNQNHELAANSPLELANSSHASNKPLDCARNKTMPTNNGHSFFRFSWTGFNKNEECSPIKEEEYCDGKKYGPNNSRRPAFNLDPGILKPNIWAGTQIQLFKTRRQEKEGFSLLDMTSSLFRRLRFGSTTSVSSLDTVNTNLNNYATNSNNLTPVSSRPWTPRDSLNSK